MKASKIISGFIAIILVLVIVGAIAFLLVFIRNDGKNFYVTYGENSASKNYEATLPKNVFNVFYCKNLSDIVENGVISASDYTVEVNINQDKVSNFDYSVDGKRYQFHKTDLTPAFQIQQYDGFFTLYLPYSLTVADVLGKVYDEQTIDYSAVPSVSLYDNYSLYLTVTSKQEENASVTIYFN